MQILKREVTFADKVVRIHSLRLKRCVSSFKAEDNVFDALLPAQRWNGKPLDQRAAICFCVHVSTVFVINSLAHIPVAQFDDDPRTLSTVRVSNLNLKPPKIAGLHIKM